jgi:hypothetical protein
MTRNDLVGMLIGVLLLTMALPALAAENGYCYIVAYSLRQKAAFFTPVFVQKVGGESYSSTEYCADVELIQKMESQFQGYIQNSILFSSPDLTVSARAAYKTSKIADELLEKEKKGFSTREFEIKEVADFHFRP